MLFYTHTKKGTALFPVIPFYLFAKKNGTTLS